MSHHDRRRAFHHQQTQSAEQQRRAEARQALQVEAGRAQMAARQADLLEALTETAEETGRIRRLQEQSLTLQWLDRLPPV